MTVVPRWNLGERLPIPVLEAFLMAKKRNTALLVLTLVSVGVLYATIGKLEMEELGNQIIVPDDVQLGRALRAIPPLFPPAAGMDRDCSGGTLIYEKYCVISPYEKEVRIDSNATIVTLCAQATVEYLQFVLALCHRWSAPISVAVYSPSEDYEEARTKVNLLRRCNICIRYWVDWHFFFPNQETLPPLDHSSDVGNCSSILQMKRSKKRRSQGTYPINVGRNIARRLARTPFVFSSDIELYPSLDIPAKFERMLRSQTFSGRQVWVLPVFEVHSSVRAPLYKSQLRELFAQKKAISFHMFRCDICHKIPNLTQWMEYGENWRISELQESLEPLKIWTTVKRNRHYKLQEWEPFFIGTTREPEFDVRLSWEGKQNKMQMAYEMCMLDYDFQIVENAFLVHAPGINIYNAAKEKDRVKHLAQNSQVIKKVKKDLIQKYGSKNDCG